jgi:phosphate transport system ATP-binding protein
MGPSKSGKSTLLRVLNRMSDLIVRRRPRLAGHQDSGRTAPVGRAPWPVRSAGAPAPPYRESHPGPRPAGQRDRTNWRPWWKPAKAAQLWDEVKDRLADSALKLSGGQQQRLCLARTLAMEPEVILLDEPTSGLDPISTAKIEETLSQLKKNYTIILVSNNTKQIARATDRVAFLLMSQIIEIGDTHRVFTVPQDKRTDDYISGRFG